MHFCNPAARILRNCWGTSSNGWLPLTLHREVSISPSSVLLSLWVLPNVGSAPQYLTILVPSMSPCGPSCIKSPGTQAVPIIYWIISMKLYLRFTVSQKSLIDTVTHLTVSTEDNIDLRGVSVWAPVDNLYVWYFLFTWSRWSHFSSGNGILVLFPSTVCNMSIFLHQPWTEPTNCRSSKSVISSKHTSPTDCAMRGGRLRSP